jgi:hypothetical protein
VPRILLSASFPESLLARQTPGHRGQWEDHQYLFQPGETPVDAWVVYDNLRQPLKQTCPTANTLLITGEPASVRQYRPHFTRQFARIWTAQPRVRHPHVTRRNECQHWHYAMRPSHSHGQPLGFDQLVALEPPQKPKLMSVVCSNKAITPDQRQRLAFVEQLREQFGSAIDFFGRGFTDLEDKADAIWPYRYHIVLENDHTECFMTEKISDAFLGWSYPIYFGGSEAHHRFPLGSFSAIDIYRPKQAIEIIRTVLTDDTYEQSLQLIAEARHAVLYKHNLFAMLTAFWREHLSRGPARTNHLLPKSNRAALIVNQLKQSFRNPWQRSAA